MPKLYVCGITQNKAPYLQRIIDICTPYVDGFLFVDGGSTDGTIELLEKSSKEGKLLQRRWSNDHDLSMNEFLRAGVMKNGDFYIILDSTDIPNENWIKNIQEDVYYYSKNNVGLVYLDKPLVVRYFDHQRIVGNPHWGLAGVIGNVISLSQIDGYKKEHYVVNNRDTLQSAFMHPIKYYYVYANSNHTQLLYQQFGNQIWDFHENLRIQFRLFCETVLGLELTLESLTKYMTDNKEWPEFFMNIVETEVNLKDLYRLKVLNQPWEMLAENRFNWSIRKCLQEGKLEQAKNDGFVGIFNQYRLQQGKQME